MDSTRLGVIEAKFADMIWENAPLPSGQLAVLAQNLLGWKKSTTYTVLRRLCDRGIFQNESGIVSAKISRDDFYAMQSEKFVEETFSGSLPAFLTAFASRKKLSAKEIEKLQALIDEMKEE